jgi:hypothetical protein
MNLVFSLLVVLLVTFPLRGERMLEKLPPRPLSGVSDVSNWLTKMEKKSWKSRIDALLAESDIEMIIMIVPMANANDIPVDVLLQRIAQNWVTKSCCGIIVHTPGRADSPRVLMTGSAIQAAENTPAEIREMIIKIEQFSQLESTDDKRLNAAFEALKEQLLPFRENLTQLEAMTDEQKINAYSINTSIVLKRKMKLIAIGFGVPLVLAALGYGFYRWRKYHQPVTFLSTSPRKRFCSPYAGGGGSSLSFIRGKKPSR